MIPHVHVIHQQFDHLLLLVHFPDYAAHAFHEAVLVEYFLFFLLIQLTFHDLILLMQQDASVLLNTLLADCSKVLLAQWSHGNTCKRLNV